MSETAERVSGQNRIDNYVYQRCLFAYHAAAPMIHGKVLEIGTGSGLGVELMSSCCEEFTTVDKYECDLDFTLYPNVKFIKMEIPPFHGISDNSFDFVISFQVIEHIEDDFAFVKEICRVLKPGGKVILTTHNNLQSLSRNPWHVREYLASELMWILKKAGFSEVDQKGTYGNLKVLDYIEANKKSIRKFTRFDIFNLQYRLPRRLLQIPYDILNKINRKLIADQNKSLTSDITIADFTVENAKDDCLDLFFIATK